jgi:hypothetical protein
MEFEQWLTCGQALIEIEGAVQWWLGDWWAYGDHDYGERKALFEEGGPLADANFHTIREYGTVARAVTSEVRSSLVSWKHHHNVAHLPPDQQREWLTRAEKEGWSSNELKSAIARAKAIEQTTKVNFQAEALGKFPLLYADPPWQYENPARWTAPQAL